MRKLSNHRITTAYFVALFCSSVLLTGCNGHHENQERPNIIFILADDMGFGVPGCYGGEMILTPHIDSLAMHGVLFTQAYAGCSVCAPSRASLLTGQHTGHVSVRGNTGGIPLADRDTTFAEILRSAGYQVGGFGKWGLGDRGTEGVPEKQGFDRFFGYYHQIHAHFYYTDYLWENSRKVEMLNAHGDSASYSHYRIMEEMKQFIIANRSGPFFCFGSWTLPHTDDDGFPQIPETDPAYALYKQKSWSEEEKQYAAMNSRVDYDLGEIVKLLRELGIDRKTIVIFSSDNGGGADYDSLFHVNGTLKGSKHQFYEGGIKVPLIFSWPGKIEAGSHCDLMCYFPDLMPTFLEMAGTEHAMPGNVDGFSLVPSLTGGRVQYSHEYLYWELPAYDWTNNIYLVNGLQQAIRVADWKLLRHDSHNPWELYNLSTDTGETRDIAEDQPEIVSRLANMIETHRTAVPPQKEPEMPEGKWFR